MRVSFKRSLESRTLLRITFLVACLDGRTTSASSNSEIYNLHFIIQYRCNWNYGLLLSSANSISASNDLGLEQSSTTDELTHTAVRLMNTDLYRIVPYVAMKSCITCHLIPALNFVTLNFIPKV